MNVMKDTLEFIKETKNGNIEAIKNYIIAAENNTIFYPDEEGVVREGTLIEVILHYMNTSFDSINMKNISLMKEIVERINAIPEILATIKNKGFELKCKNFNFGEKLVEKGVIGEKVLNIAEEFLFEKSSKIEKIRFLAKVIEKNNDVQMLNSCLERINDFDKDYSILLFVALKENLYIDNFDCLLKKIPEVDINYRNKEYSESSVFEFLCLNFGFKFCSNNNIYGTGNINIDYLNDIYTTKKAVISHLFLTEKSNKLLAPVECFIKEKVAAQEKEEMNKAISIFNNPDNLKRRL